MTYKLILLFFRVDLYDFYIYKELNKLINRHTQWR